jgi:hypothetical protein
MTSYAALFEDEEDIFSGTPQSKYWDIAAHITPERIEYEFDLILTKMAAMEEMLMAQHDEESLDKIIHRYGLENAQAVENRKKSLYMEYAGNLIYQLAD